MKDGVAKLDDVDNVEDSFEIHDGVSRSNGWPTDASFEMKKRFPKDVALADSLSSPGFVVLSGAVKKALDGVEKVEWLPVKIINHKGSVASADYFILNPLAKVACVDAQASGAKFDPVHEGMISTCEKLVLREDTVPAHLQLFRATEMSGLILVRRALAAKLTAYSGLHFVEPDQFKG